MQIRPQEQNKSGAGAGPKRVTGVQLVLMLLFGLGVFIAAILLLPEKPEPSVSATGTNQVAKAAPAREIWDATNEYMRGEKIARAVCGSCHLFPEPGLLDRVTWGMVVLPGMESWLGMAEPDFASRPGGDRVKAAKIFPDSPVMSAAEWRAVCSYYLEAAPARFLPPTDRPKLEASLKQFEIVPTKYHHTVPATTLVKIDTNKHQLYVGDVEAKTLSVLGARGEVMSESPVESGPVSVLFRPDGLYVTLIGDLHPSDLAQGKLISLPTAPTGSIRTNVMLTELHRPSDMVVADLNGDGREDLLVCQYGNLLGHFSWYENLGDGKYKEHILINRPGAIKAYVHDFNHDGRPDIIVLMAQAREGIYILHNEGDGNFRETTVAEFPPSWGSSYFEMADFNGDGFPDLLVTNGDNGDLTSLPAPYKKYHGVRIFLNDGKNQFKESWFYAMNGAYKAMARDFDNDGDLDIAAISFFPDYLHSPRESFIYFENIGGKGKLGFKPVSIPESFSGRWMTMDVGDLDGDGKPDIVLGAFNNGPGSVPTPLVEGWKTMGPSVLILKNARR